MTIGEIKKIVNGEGNVDNNIKIKNIKTNSKDVKKNDLFIALKGKKYDGNIFIEEALKKGAICITDKDNNNCIKVEDTRDALYKLSNYIRNEYDIPLIAVTGSNGKTTTKELIYHILSSKYNVLKNDKSENNIYGVSNTLFKLNKDYDLIVMELGSNHIGEISELSNMCNPTLGVITNIGSSHLEYFKTRKNIFKEKYSIISGMKKINLIVNGDSKYLKNVKCYKCGLNLNNDLIAYNIYESFEFISFNIYLDKEYKIIFNSPGKHFINDILLAIKVCLNFNIDIKTIIEKIKDFKLSDKRMNILKYDSNYIINDCYNSSYESVCAGIDILKNIHEHKILIIGDILELGKYSKKIHKKLNKKISELDNYIVYTVGNFSKYINGINFEDSEHLIEYLKNENINNSYIYIKGSRKMYLEKIVEYFEHN